MSTNGSKAAPSRERIIREAAYYAAVFGWYDTSEAAQKANLLTVTVMDMADISGEVVPTGATHQLFVCINATAYLVTRYPDRYGVTPYDQTAQYRQERELREAVLDMALWHFTGAEVSDYPPGGVTAAAAGPECDSQSIQEARGCTFCLSLEKNGIARGGHDGTRGIQNVPSLLMGLRGGHFSHPLLKKPVKGIE